MDLDPPVSNESQNSSRFTTLAVVLLALFLTYPLGLGPAIRLAKAYPSTKPCIETIYVPLVLVIDRSPAPVGKAFYFYLHSIWRAI
jgi:hypothetical protein